MRRQYTMIKRIWNWLQSTLKSRPKLPVDGSCIEYTSQYQYGEYIWKGKVHHHEDGKSFFIETDNNTLTSINRKSYEKALREARIKFS